MTAKPSISGMSRSTRTTDGRVDATSSMASAPALADLDGPALRLQGDPDELEGHRVVVDDDDGAAARRGPWSAAATTRRTELMSSSLSTGLTR